MDNQLNTPEIYRLDEILSLCLLEQRYDEIIGGG